MTAYECFVLYVSMKTHFSNPKYDFFKFKGKSKVNIQSFEKRKDKYFFSKVAEKYNKKNFIDFLAANFIKDNYWIGDLRLYGEENYICWKTKIESLSYVFMQEIEIILNEVDNFNTLFLCEDNQHPLLLKFYISDKVSLETLCLLNNKLNFLEYFDRKINEKIIWPNISLKINKYTPFIPCNQEKINTILRESLLERKVS